MRKRFSGSSAFQDKKGIDGKPKATTTGAQAMQRDGALAQALLNFRAQARH